MACTECVILSRSPDHRSQCQHVVQHISSARSARSTLSHSTSCHRHVHFRRFEIKCCKCVFSHSHGSGAVSGNLLGNGGLRRRPQEALSWAAELRESYTCTAELKGQRDLGQPSQNSYFLNRRVEKRAATGRRANTARAASVKSQRSSECET